MSAARALSYPFRQRPWPDIAAFIGGMADRHPDFRHMADVVDSVIASGSASLLAGDTWMHDLVVVPAPAPEPPHDVVVVRAPSSMRPPRRGRVVVEHLSVTGRDERIERPAADAVPLFWRFLIEKCGIRPVNPPHA